jgi:integrase
VTVPADLADRVRGLRDASASDNTRRAYLSDWRRWDDWCAARGFPSIPAHPDTVCAYLADQSERVKVSTLSRHLATISKAHQVAGVPNPCQSVAVRDTLRGLRRTLGTSRSEAPALVAPDLRATLDALPDTLAGDRDRALLLVGWCGGLRRSEVAGLTWGDLATVAGGVVVTLTRSKTDQVGAGRQVALPRQGVPRWCPVAALDALRARMADYSPDLVADSAPVFVAVSRWDSPTRRALSGAAVAGVVTRRTAGAGLDTRYRGHSLRKGLVVAASESGVADSAIMATTGHRSVAMLRQYQGQADLMSRAASRGLLG